MRYHIDEFTCDGKEIYIKGWALPEHRKDTMKVYLRTLEGEELNPTINYEERHDVMTKVLSEDGDEKYGFKLYYTLKDLSDLELYFDALEFDIDFARLRLRVKETYQACKKAMRKKRK